MAGPLGGFTGDPRAATINPKNIGNAPLWWVLMKIQQRPTSMLENIDGEPAGRCYQRIWERLSSTLENINGGPPGRF
jgi:hypothetical protein